MFFLSLILSNDLSNGSYIRENFFLPITRMWEFFAGALVSYYFFFIKKNDFNLFTKNLFSATGVLFLIYSFLFLDKYSHPSFLTIIPVLGTCLIILFGTGETIIGKILSWKYIVGVGLISYSLYLWHVPVFVFARHYNFMFNSEIGNYYSLTNIKYFFLIIIVFIMSYFSWKYVEQPFRQKKLSNNNLKYKKISDSNLIKLSITSFVILFLTGYLINKNDGFIERFPNKVTNYLNYEHSYASDEIINPCKESFNKTLKRKIMNEKFKEKKILDECRILGYKNNNSKTVLIGDSLTQSLLPTFDDYFISKKSSFYYYSENCFETEGFMIEGNCLEDFTIVLNDTKIENIILFFRWSERFYSLNLFEGVYFCGDYKCKNQEEIREFKKREKNIQKSFKTKINLLLEKNKKIFIIYPLPSFGFNPPKYLASRVMNKQKPLAFVDYDDFVYRNSNVKKFFNSLEGNIERIHPEKIFCKTYYKNKCAANYKEKVFFADSSHLSLDGGFLLGNKVLEKMSFLNGK